MASAERPRKVNLPDLDQKPGWRQCKDGTRQTFPRVSYPPAIADRGFELLDRLYLIEYKLGLKYNTWDVNIMVLSGYRTRPLNYCVGGVPHSQHKQGRAVDFRARYLHPDKGWQWIPLEVLWWAVNEVHAEGNWIGGAGKYYRNPSKGRRVAFVHIDIRPPKPNGGPARWVVK